MDQDQDGSQINGPADEFTPQNDLHQVGSAGVKKSLNFHLSPGQVQQKILTCSVAK